MVRNNSAGFDLTKMVVDRQQPGFIVSEIALMIAASGREELIEMLQLWMDNGGSDIPIKEALVLEAARNYYHGPLIIDYLFELHRHSLPMTENVLVALAENPSPDTSHMLAETLERFPEAVLLSVVMQVTSQNISTLWLLLERATDLVPIRQVLEKIGAKRGEPRQEEARKTLTIFLD
ncbi:hypothetical protein ASPWEDRAFT_45354 [Aspergillus wentii DTO 134E9]|uniref:HEAT repeat domain-containing protein n=1 Tax=Aspergillus wentii DTO 134E9 TaxID=1073089 RepID=A0A1L9R918_ASPWE|nr:uncharacterized protein ASPWEDRAFT_45354 [Aspergillus wentii DTO 134E9]OJJ31421.1 hypothetical protein ASPWEDRAFT_45354 [Aspergillus wentii DTO 134E9]